MDFSGGGSFEARQRRFIDRIADLGVEGVERGTIVVVPSITFPGSELKKIIGIQRYEERMLFAALWLSNPDVRVVFVTSLPVDGEIVDYYLSFVDDPAGPRSRLTLIDAGDPEPVALTAKLLERPAVVERIRDAIADSDDAFILPFNVTSLERILADRLELPIYGPDASLAHLGSKSGARRIAREAGVPVSPGAEDLWSVADVYDAITAIRDDNPDAVAVVIKLNNGFSGQGNAIVSLDRLRPPLDHSDTVFCAQEESWESYAGKITTDGCIVEELHRGPGVLSPSVQLRVAPGGHIEVVSTHDQILGGPDDQVYLGCRFPARPDYRMAIQEHACKVAEVLAGKGVIGMFGMDFVVLPEGTVYLSEINLRVGGTTHPHFMTRLVSGGVYDAGTGNLVVDGTKKHYVATDNLKSDSYKGVSPSRVIEEVERRGLSYSKTRHTGVTLHLLGALHDYGKMGVTCVADSHDEADELYAEVIGAINAATGHRPNRPLW